ncbi:MAG: NTP transferase domain-containing protein [Clostridiales bacterium]|nr:NTP transferase domain-containing protein [Clostridiales bacterium]
MNRYDADVFSSIVREGAGNQRTIASRTGLSLGVVNKSVKNLKDEGYISEDLAVLKPGMDLIKKKTPANAVILAAGFGMRMVPINLEVPKALLQVKGQTLIERQIEQLHEAGIKDITVVVGFLMEQFEYLIDRYGVDLVPNSEYFFKNNLYSVDKVVDRIGNTYIIPCDIWCRNNPFTTFEPYSWYMVSEEKIANGGIKLNRQLEITGKGEADANKMIGISYIDGEDAEKLRSNVKKLTQNPANDNLFWEAALFDLEPRINAKIISASDAVEINTYEQLREFDSDSNQLRSDAIDVIAGCFGADHSEIVDIEILKKGMTNRSFIFTCKGDRYIMRIPGEGTDLLIDREHEAEVYHKISGRGFCDDPVYIDPKTGYKITRFLNDVRSLDPLCEEDLRKGMKLLKKFHDSDIKVGHDFDIYGQIEYYMTLCKGSGSVYKDHDQTQENILSLRSFVENHTEKKCLTHIDAIPDNFLFYKDSDGLEKLQLTDWEYSGMQDPLVDLAMFSIYSYYTREQADHLIDIYFDGKCDAVTRIKIYCYIASCGLLWSNWCDFKRTLGVEFGEYSLKQYRYAKDFFKLAMEEAQKEGICIR